MVIRNRLALVALLLAGATAPARASAAPVETIVQDDALMLHASEADVRRGMERARDLGIDRVRLTAGWSVIAPHPDSPLVPIFDATDPAKYPAGSWDHLDRAVRIATETGIAPMIDIAFWAPRWATSEPLEMSSRLAADVNPRLYADFAQAVARRYSGTWTPPHPSAQSPAATTKPPDRTILDDLFGRPPSEPAPAPAPTAAPEPLPAVDTFTIWNEPNHSGFLRPQWAKEDGRWVPKSAEIYRAMVRAAYPAIKSVAQGSRVLIGGTASMGSSTPGVSGVPPLRFLRALACVDDELRPVSTGGCEGYSELPGDGWAHHPYSLRTTPDVDTMDQDKLPVAATPRLTATLRALVDGGRLAPANADLYLTEYGYETNRPDPNAPFSLEQQADLLAWAEQIATRDPAVRSWPQFQLYDRPDVAPRDGMRAFGDWHSGLYFNDGTPKPAAGTYATPGHAACVGTGRRRWAEVWGRLRGRASDGQATVEARVGAGEWRAVRSFSRPSRRADGSVQVRQAAGGTVRRYVPHTAGTAYRLRWSAERASAAVAPAGPACRSVSRPRRSGRAKARPARRRS